MRWHEITREEASVSDMARSFIMDILAPLKAQGVTTITVNQIIDQLKDNPDFQGNAIESDMVMDALKDVKNVEVKPDIATGQLSIFIDNPVANRPADEKQSEKDSKTVRSAAMRTINKGEE